MTSGLTKATNDTIASRIPEGAQSSCADAVDKVGMQGRDEPLQQPALAFRHSKHTQVPHPMQEPVEQEQGQQYYPSLQEPQPQQALMLADSDGLASGDG